MARKALLCSALLACAMALALPYALAEESFSQSATIELVEPVLHRSFEEAHARMAAEAGEFGTAWAAAEDEAVAGMRARARTARALRAAEARGEKLSARRRAAQEAQDAKGRALQQNEGEELSFPDEAPTDLVAYPVNRTTLVQAVGTKGSGLLRRWQGVDNRQNVAAGTTPRFPLDMSLCSSASFLVQAVNNVLGIFELPSRNLLATVSLVQLAGANTSNAERVSDPRCYYDTDAQRFVVTAGHWKRTGTRPFSYTAVFVSRTPNPTATWARVRLDSSGRNVPNSARRGDATFSTNATAEASFTNAPGTGFMQSIETPSLNCDPSCYGDFPTLGHDANGVYVGVDLYNNFVNIPGTELLGPFIGVQLLAVPKRFLFSPVAAATPYVVYNAPAMKFDSGSLMTVQPAMPSQGSKYDAALNGTAWFATHSVLNDGIVLLALAGTERLGNPRGRAPTLVKTLVPYDPIARFDTSNNMTDWKGDTINLPNIQLEQLTQANNIMYTAMVAATLLDYNKETYEPIIDPNDGAILMGIRANIRPGVNGTGPTINANVVTQGLWALEGYKLAFPAIASDPSGRAVIVASAFAAAKGPRGTDVPGVVYTGIGPLGLSKNAYWLQAPINPLNATTLRWGDYLGAQYDAASRTVYIAGMYCNTTKSFNVGGVSSWDNVEVAIGQISHGELVPRIK